MIRVLARVVASMQRKARPAALRGLMAGIPKLGEAPVVARLGGAETTTPAGVFVPTPDAETLAELVLEYLPTDEPALAIDCGTGSGAIALAVAVARPQVFVHGVELDKAGARAAGRNAKALRVTNVSFMAGSLLDPLPPSLEGRAAVLVANLPFYPARRFAGIGSVARSAIQGSDDDGLGLYRALLPAAARIVRPGGTLILQMFPEQWEVLGEQLRAAGFQPIEGRPLAMGTFVAGVARRHQE